MSMKRRSFAAVVSVDHTILVFGGVAGSNLGEVCQAEWYDPGTDVWTPLPVSMKGSNEPFKIGACTGTFVPPSQGGGPLGTVYLGLSATGQLVRYDKNDSKAGGGGGGGGGAANTTSDGGGTLTVVAEYKRRAANICTCRAFAFPPFELC